MNNIERARMSLSAKLLFLCMATAGLAGCASTGNSSASQSSSGSGFLSFLGSIAQGVAAAGGKNSAQLKTVASSIQTTNGRLASGSGNAAPLPASVNTATPSSAPRIAGVAANNSPTQSKDPFRYSDAVNECVSNDASYRLHNSCSFAISITHCHEGTVTHGDYAGRSYSECSKHVFGVTELPAGGVETIGGTDYLGTRIKFIACKQPYYLPSSKLIYNGTQIQGKCQTANT